MTGKKTPDIHRPCDRLNATGGDLRVSACVAPELLPDQPMPQDPSHPSRPTASQPAAPADSDIGQLRFGALSLVCAALMYPVMGLGHWQAALVLLPVALTLGHLAHSASPTELNRLDRKLALVGLILTYLGMALAIGTVAYFLWTVFGGLFSGLLW
ncbi:hypothetical protein [Chitiniphilus shinanonensis]|uniref:hypothetical protein n=1 Tax=Chitiniphilus shinanonensis TaxID=553088 RepID=UPI00333F2FCD